MTKSSRTAVWKELPEMQVWGRMTAMLPLGWGLPTFLIRPAAYTHTVHWSSKSDASCYFSPKMRSHCRQLSAHSSAGERRSYCNPSEEEVTQEAAGSRASLRSPCLSRTESARGDGLGNVEEEERFAAGGFRKDEIV